MKQMMFIVLVALLGLMACTDSNSPTTPSNISQIDSAYYKKVYWSHHLIGLNDTFKFDSTLNAWDTGYIDLMLSVYDMNDSSQIHSFVAYAIPSNDNIKMSNHSVYTGYTSDGNKYWNHVWTIQKNDNVEWNKNDSTNICIEFQLNYEYIKSCCNEKIYIKIR